MIPLVRDTINNEDIDKLIEWLKTYPKLTKGKLTTDFEDMWSRFQKRKYSTYVNSGSSANLAMVYAFKLSKRNINKNKRIVVPTLSWVTTVSPVIQLGYDPILCEVDKQTLGLDPDYFEMLCEKYKPEAAIVTHILGIPCNMKRIMETAEKYDVVVLEDSCEAVGSTSNGTMTGNFGLMSTFSYYFGHHMSTIEGGMVCTDDKEMDDLLKMIRSHGWSRDLDDEKKEELSLKYKISEFNDMFTFYVPSFNLRATDLQAFIGIKQIPRLYENCEKRYQNFKQYQLQIENDYWKLPYQYDMVSNFAYPIIHPKRNDIVKRLKENDIEVRPLVCGSIARQPFYRDLYGLADLKFGDEVHLHGCYVPNNPELTKEEINKICSIINMEIKK